MTINLATPVFTDDGDEYELGDYPVEFVHDLYQILGSEDDVVDVIVSGGYTPDYCPERELDLRGNIVVNGRKAECYLLGYLDGEVEDWGDHFEGVDVDSAHEGEKVSSRLSWCKANCQGAWVVTTDQHIHSSDFPFRVLISFADPTDEAKFMVEFGLENQ